ncbi:hypothetical protein [Salipiger thiooxidans]|uniref:hypothetical protein n=1 Tax=Salipiger thiooxidans TaxID=282683 RepID=UPI001CD75BC9|nr:hypothetical protein [Salipiger thiooxidans]MCA0846097.1 hypothetical protein [Salipiger thiooxidans]
MKVMDVLSRIKSGERVMVHLASRDGHKKKYTLTDGTDVPDAQFCRIREFLQPADAGLFDGAEPQSYQWGG